VERGAAATAFLQKLENLISATPPGTMLTAAICGAYHAGLEKFARTPGVRSAARAEAGLARAGAALFVTDAKTFLGNHDLTAEVFGPSTLVVACDSCEEMTAAAKTLEGQLTATIHASAEELPAHGELISILSTKAGRLVFNGFPTGVEVGHAMTHGGPYPATADGRSTSVGTRAIERFLRPVSFQNFPDAALPDELREGNPLGLWRLVDGTLKK
jgi:NADP-dependent aldehyde dehydrogenase